MAEKTPHTITQLGGRRIYDRRIQDILTDVDSLRTEPSASRVIMEAIKIGNKAYFQTSHFRDTLAEPGISEEALRRAVNDQLYPHTATLSPERETLMQAVVVSQKIGRDILRNILEGENALGLSKLEQIVFRHSLDIADRYDDLRVQWLDKVANNSIVKNAIHNNGDDTTKAKEYLFAESGLPKETIDLNYQYLTFEEAPGGKIEAVPYRLAFKDTYDSVTDSYRAMLEDIRTHERDNGQTEESFRFSEYISKLLIATDYALNDPFERERLFAETDIAWLKAMRSSRIYLEHPFETYFDPLGINVEPEFKIGIKDDQAEAINQQALITRDKMLPALLDMFPDGEVGHRALMNLFSAMQQSELHAYMEVVAGISLEKRSVAANIPNRQGIRESHSVHINADMQTFPQRDNLTREVISRIFGNDSSEYSEYIENAEEFKLMELGVFVTGHEVGHNGFMLPDAQKRLTPKLYSQVEENKADLIIISTAQSVLDNDPEKLAKFIKTTLYRSIRNLTRIDSEELRPYYNGSLMYVNLMGDLGIITRNEAGEWQVNLTDDNMSQFFDASKTILRELVAIYEAGNSSDAQSFIDKYYVEGPVVKDLQRALGVAQTTEPEDSTQ